MTSGKYAPESCVNWSAFTVPQLWEMVVGEGDPVTYQQVSAWQQTHDAITEHARRLRTSRDELLASWPPERSEAAAAFANHVEKLLIIMDGNAGVAARNAQALRGIAEALAEAKTRLLPIYQEWRQQEQRQQEQSVAGKVVNTLTFWSDEDAWRAKLNERASRVMVAADTQVGEQRQQLRVPDPFEVKDISEPGPKQDSSPSAIATQIAGADGLRWAGPPQIAPPTQTWSLTEGRATALDPTPSGAGGPPTGPVLASDGPGAPTAPLERPPAIQPPSTATVPGIIGGGEERRSATTGGTRGVAGSAPMQPFTGSRSGRPASAVGGVIGGPPAIVGGFGQRNGPENPTRRVSPVGGVIAGGHTSGVAASVQAGRRDKSDRRPPGFDPDHPWAVTQGGPGVLTGAEEPKAPDPGPGVIGMDR